MSAFQGAVKTNLLKAQRSSDRNAVEMPDITTKYSDSKCTLLKNWSNEEKRLKIRSMSIISLGEKTICNDFYDSLMTYFWKV